MRTISKIIQNWHEYLIKEYIDRIDTPWVYYNADLWLISLSEDWHNWITISDKNAWATTVWNQWDTQTETNCWYFYQWWNCYWFLFTQSITTDSNQVDASAYWPNNYYSSSTFIAIPYWNWDSSNNGDLWWDVTDTLEARKWMCDEWFHIPSYDEWNSMDVLLDHIWTRTSDAYQNILKIPLTWLIDQDWHFYWGWIEWKYCFSSEWYFNFGNWYVNWCYSDFSFWTCDGYSVRPFKNEPVVPTSSWTVMYQPN